MPFGCAQEKSIIYYVFRLWLRYSEDQGKEDVIIPTHFFHGMLQHIFFSLVFFMCYFRNLSISLHLSIPANAATKMLHRDTANKSG